MPYSKLNERTSHPRRNIITIGDQRIKGLLGHEAHRSSGECCGGRDEGPRAGFLTSAARRGASVFKMRDVSQHKSMDVLQAPARHRSTQLTPP